MQRDLLKKIISSAAAVLLGGLAYYGSYLPLRKSQLFIGTMQKVGNVGSIEELEDLFSVPLDAPSPIGQEELVRNFGNVALATSQRAGRPEVTGALLGYLESYFEPIIARGRGMSFNQNLYILGAFNEIAFMQTKDPKYLAGAEKYFGKSFDLGPKRPQPLYGLFDVYRLENNVSGTVAIAAQILDQWPSDAKTQGALAKFLSRVPPGPGKK